jgi:hypothetical protein
VQSCEPLREILMICNVLWNVQRIAAVLLIGSALLLLFCLSLDSQDP